MLFGIIDGVNVVVHPLAPGMATDFTPRLLIFTVRPVPVLAVVVVYVMQSGGLNLA